MSTPGLAFPEQYEDQLEQKIAAIKNQFSNFSLPEIEIFASPPSHYRMRAEFKIWKQEGSVKFVMFNKDAPKTPIEITDFSIGSPKICELMQKLLPILNENEILKHRLFQVEFLTTRTNEAVTTLIYHRKLDDEWSLAASALQEKLKTNIIGRSKGQKVVLGNDYIIEQFNVAGRNFQYQQVETGFTQPNAFLCEKMLNWAQSNCPKNAGESDLLELYCGNGNFTLPLATQFRRVLATEVSKTSVKSALFNIEKNRIENIDIARMSSEEFTQALNGDREFRRLKDIALDEFDFSTIFVDPPRSGLDKDTETLVKRFKNILYISCNPNTLHENLLEITKTHAIEKFAVFDQFPYTNHIECGVTLKLKR